MKRNVKLFMEYMFTFINTLEIGKYLRREESVCLPLPSLKGLGTPTLQIEEEVKTL